MWLLLSKIVTQILATAILVGTASVCAPVLQLMPTSAASKEQRFTGDLLCSVVCTWAGRAPELISEAALAFFCPFIQIWQKQVDNKHSSHLSSCLCVSCVILMPQICYCAEKGWLCSGCVSADAVGKALVDGCPVFWVWLQRDPACSFHWQQEGFLALK